jgi:hypothetical protein
LHSFSSIYSSKQAIVVRTSPKFSETPTDDGDFTFLMTNYVVILVSNNFANDRVVLSAARTTRPNQVFVPGVGELDCSLPRNPRAKTAGKARPGCPPVRRRRVRTAFLLVPPAVPVIAIPPPSLGTAAAPPDDSWAEGFDLAFYTSGLNSVADCDSDFDFANFGFF